MMNNMIQVALEIAVTHHAGQYDKAGSPYILHVLRVMNDVHTDDDLIITAILHDIVEDTDVTLDDLKMNILSDDIVIAIDLLTHRKSDNYDFYIKRLSHNRLARLVKIADLKDNMNLGRLNKITETDQKRFEKYKFYSDYLKSVDRGDNDTTS